MKVLVDALPLRHGGGVTYLTEQLAALARVSTDISLRTLVSPWSSLSVLPGTVETPHLRSVADRFAYEQLVIPWRSTEVLYCPANFGPVMARSPVVLTLHNPNYYGLGLALPEAKPSRPWWKLRANYASMRRADVIVAISHAFAAEVARSVPKVADKIRVIHSGAPNWPAESIPMAGLPDRYVLMVTSAAPHKHNEDVLVGWSRSLELSSEALPLVVVGGFTDEQVYAHRSLVGRHANMLTHLGMITDRSKLKGVYERASALVSMSVLESFGLTPSEAGAVGCPLLLSDIPCHREVTMENAVFVPVRRPNALAQILAKQVTGWTPGSRNWDWPVTWDDNARALASLFKEVVDAR